MPTLHEIHAEIQSHAHSTVPQDVVRRGYLQKLSEYTKVPTLIYASSFTIKDIAGDFLQINRQDVQLFMSALKDIKGEDLDLILHTPGGSAEATEQIVNYLRSKFNKIRVIIPQNAMSAGTMLACAANEIVMGKHSAIGPIDPQLLYNGKDVVAAQSIIDEFHYAQASINGGDNPLLWVQKINQYHPGLLIQCQNQIQLAKSLVHEWLEKFMFKDDEDKSNKSSSIAEWLGDAQRLLSHGRSINYEKAKEKGLRVSLLEDDQELQELVLSVFHSTVATFQLTHCVKIVENNFGKGTYVQYSNN